MTRLRQHENHHHRHYHLSPFKYQIGEVFSCLCRPLHLHCLHICSLLTQVMQCYTLRGMLLAYVWVCVLRCVTCQWYPRTFTLCGGESSFSKGWSDHSSISQRGLKSQRGHQPIIWKFSSENCMKIVVGANKESKSFSMPSVVYSTNCQSTRLCVSVGVSYWTTLGAGNGSYCGLVALTFGVRQKWRHLGRDGGSTRDTPNAEPPMGWTIVCSLKFRGKCFNAKLIFVNFCHRLAKLPSFWNVSKYSKEKDAMRFVIHSEDADR